MATIEIDDNEIEGLRWALFCGASSLDNGTNTKDGELADRLRELADKL